MRYRKEYLEKNNKPKIIITTTPMGNNVWRELFDDINREYDDIDRRYNR